MGYSEAEWQILMRNVEQARNRSHVKRTTKTSRREIAPTLPSQPRSKYRSRRVQYEGQWFDSQKECSYWQELQLHEQVGAIRDLRRQVRYPLSVTNLETGEISELGAYVADAVYFDVALQCEIVIDVKGWKTLPLAKWKQKHFTAQYRLHVTEVR